MPWAFRVSSHSGADFMMEAQKQTNRSRYMVNLTGGEEVSLVDSGLRCSVNVAWQYFDFEDPSREVKDLLDQVDYNHNGTMDRPKLGGPLS